MNINRLRISKGQAEQVINPDELTYQEIDGHPRYYYRPDTNKWYRAQKSENDTVEYLGITSQLSDADKQALSKIYLEAPVAQDIITQNSDAIDPNERLAHISLLKESAKELLSELDNEQEDLMAAIVAQNESIRQKRLAQEKKERERLLAEEVANRNKRYDERIAQEIGLQLPRESHLPGVLSFQKNLSEYSDPGETLYGLEKQLAGHDKPRPPMKKTVLTLGGVALVGSLAIVGLHTLPDLLNSNQEKHTSDSNQDKSQTLPTKAAEKPVALAASNLSVSRCLDDRGEGKALMLGDVSLKADMQWIYKNGSTSQYVMLQDMDPKTGKPTSQPYLPDVEVPFAPVSIADCIANKFSSAALSIKDDTITINRADITPQIFIGRNTSKLPTTAVVNLPANSAIGLTPKVVAKLKTDSSNQSTADIAAALAQNQAFQAIAKPGSDYDKQIDSSMDQKLTDLVNTQIDAFYTLKKVSAGKRVGFKTVFVGEYPTLLLKGVIPAPSSEFTIANMSVTDFNAVSGK